MSLHADAATSYTYQPLKTNEIRLALLEPSSHDDGPLRNLHWALTRARRRRQPDSAADVVVWADALCINQRDDVERGAQVAMMSRIYAKARSVLVCMGPELSFAGGSLVASLLSEWEASAATAGTDIDVEDVQWRALGALTSAPWFGRVWVLQEVGLAQNPRVIYGGGPDDTVGVEEFSYRLLRRVIAWTRSRMPNFAVYMGIEGLMVHDSWLNWSQPEAQALELSAHCQFLDLLDQGALLKCHDPRDRIYAFLGHPFASAAGPIIPDYTKPKLQVFQETTILLLHDSGIRTLASVEHDPQTIKEEAPSWVVRWDVTPTFNNIWNPYSPMYNSGVGLGTGPAWELNRNSLQIEGVVVDSVLAVFSIRVVPNRLQILFHSAGDDHWQPLTLFAPALEQDTSTPFAYSTIKAAILAHTLCGQPWDGQYEDNNLLRRFAEYLSSNHESHDWKQEMGPFYWRAETLCQGRAFVITKKGYYGLAPGICRPGDVCAVVQGGSVPFLLRPELLNAGGGAGSAMPRRLVGEMYLHDFMEGQAGSMVREGALTKELITLWRCLLFVLVYHVVYIKQGQRSGPEEDSDTLSPT
ncbi:hypothetical protein PG993_011864 [Apiospora rasikravindrae]|uniref:Heterokaryon incompatibility domain-containing protein n=1 Tax=Apiospora rasikravindrae TaxID=990691 RepID=A0ABR1S1A5_9PEZI